MQSVQLNDELYGQAARCAQAVGFASVDDYVADLIAEDVSNDDTAAENLDHLFTPERLADFTPERLARIDAAAANFRAGGKTYTADEVREHFRKRSAEQP